MKITGTLEALHSRRDNWGNVYWALRYTDHETGREVCGVVSGGASNIHGLLWYWGKPGEPDRSIRYLTQEFSIREFDQLTMGWKHAGCRSEDLARFIRDSLRAAEEGS